MRCDDLRRVYESFRKGGKEEIKRDEKILLRAVRVCDCGAYSCFLTHTTEEGSDNVTLEVRMKDFGDLSSRDAMTCFSLSLPSGLTFTAHYKLRAGAFAVVAAVMSRVSEIAHPEIYMQLFRAA
jgi:hypothetical protein